MESTTTTLTPEASPVHSVASGQTSLDYFSNATGAASDLPILAGCLEQIFQDDQQQQQQQQQQHLRLSRCEMERMSPDSSVDWAAKATSSSSPASAMAFASSSMISPVSIQQPDSTTNELLLPPPSASSAVSTSSDAAYDSDAFNSDDSNESFAELQRNPNLLNEIVLEGQRQSQPEASPNQWPLIPDVNDAAAADEGEETSPSKPKTKRRTKKKVKRAFDVLLKCQQCPYTTRYKEHLTSHMHSHSEERTHMCPDCGQTFKWSHSLKRHQRKHQQDGYKHQCRVCKKAFSRKDHLRIHEELHRAPAHGQEPFRCPVCYAAFKSKKTLAGHLKTHNAQRRAHRCPQCTSEFTRRASLNRHVRAAHAKETHCCPLCPARFSYKSTLEDHKRAAHGGGVRQFECHLCGQDFAVKAYLSKHLVTCRNRADGRSFPCTMCSKTFPSKRNLHDHAKRMHPNTPLSTAAIAAEEIARKSREAEENKQQQSQPLPAILPQLPPPPYPQQQQQQQQVLPAFEYQYQHPPKCVVVPCELCPATFADDAQLDAHLATHFPIASAAAALPATSVATSTAPFPVVTGDDLPLPQPPQPQDDANVGSLLRLVYNCPEQVMVQQQQDCYPQQQLLTHQQVTSEKMVTVSQPVEASFMDYPFEGFLAL